MEHLNQNPYFWQNSSGASTTTTTFNDIVSNGDKYLVVGKSRVDRVSGIATTNNAGVEDSLYVLLNSDFSISDAILSGTTSTDEVYSLNRIEEYQGYAIEEFIEYNPIGTYLIRIEGHLTCVIDGYCYDIWDCTDKKIDVIWKVGY